MKGFIKRDTRVLCKAAAFALALALFASLSAFAWLNHTRNLAAVAQVSNPTSIYINAANREDIKYLTLNGIDVTGADEHKDYVFCVRGNAVSSYKLQLAYTTNNQFEYEIYHAKLSDSATVPAGSLGEVVYLTHPAQNEQHYYIPSGQSPLAGSLKNEKTGTEILAKDDDDDYYTLTYGSYTNVQKYARPLYWQTTNVESAGFDDPTYTGSGDFCDYYVLRVKWDRAKDNAESAGLTLQNSKETDMIYITARNESA